MDDKTTIEQIFKLALAIHGKNDALASALKRTTLSLLEYSRPLSSLSRAELLRFKGIGPATVTYIERILAGEDVSSVAESVPQLTRVPRFRPSTYQPKDRGNWDGSWDNSVRQIEDA